MRAIVLLTVLFLLFGCVPVNLPPSVGNPYPESGATDVSLTVTLRWSANDLNGDDLTFDLYFGKSEDPPRIASGLKENRYTLENLDHGTKYYWRVVAHDSEGARGEGPLWWFVTHNDPPSVPSNPNPPDGARDVSRRPTLSWSESSDPEGDPVVYDLYLRGPGLGIDLLIVEGLTENRYPLHITLENGERYEWWVVAKDDRGGESEGPVWSFTTLNLPPSTPSDPNPPSGSVDVPRSLTLSWSCSDPEGDDLSYDVYLGTSYPPRFYRNVNSNSITVSSLQPSTVYYWKIVARDGKGGTTEGPVWNFKTAANTPPYVPSNPNPPNGSVNQPLDVVLTWTGGDPDGDGVVYDVYLDGVLKATTSSNRYELRNLSTSKTYTWRIVARDSLGASTEGPLWSFRTTDPPSVPYDPNPQVGTTVDPDSVTLSWNAHDPNGDPLTFDVYFGTIYPPPLYRSNITTRYLHVGSLEPGVRYYWKIVVRDDKGAVSEGPVWYFDTRRSELSEINRIWLFGSGRSHLVIGGNFLYAVKENPGKLVIVSLSTLDITSSLDLGRNVKDIAYRSGYLYLVTDDGFLMIYDVSDPYGPVLESTLDLYMNPYAIDLDDYGVIYIVGSEFLILDSSLEELARLYYESGVDVSVSGCMAFVSRGSNGIDVFDVSNPGAPTFVDSSYHYSDEITAYGDILYSDGYEELIIYRLNSSSLENISSHHIGSEINEISPYPGEAVLSTDAGLYVMDVSDPYDPSIEISWLGEPVNSSEKSGGRIYVLTQSGYLVVLQ